MRTRTFAPGGGAEAGADLIDTLRRGQERLIEEVMATLRAEVTGIGAIPEDQVEECLRNDLSSAIAGIAERRPPNEEELAASAALAAASAHAGMPIETRLAARRIGMRRLSELLRETADSLGYGAEAQVETISRLWEWADAMQVSDADAHRTAELEANGGGDEARAWFVRALLDGALSQAEVAARAAAYGLLPGIKYFAFRGRPAPGVDAPALARAIKASVGRDDMGVLLATVDGDVCGAAARVPRIAGEGTVGVGTESDLMRLGTSFRLANRALDTAIAFGYEGVVTLDDLSLRPAILAEAHLGERLIRRYLDPLTELGEFGVALEETVRAYLSTGMRIHDSAEALYVHPNTLRHRLDRFQEVTGADFRRTQDLLEVWWALERRTLDAASRQ
jgi:hypothetical protein